VLSIAKPWVKSPGTKEEKRRRRRKRKGKGKGWRQEKGRRRGGVLRLTKDWQLRKLDDENIKVII
jgi:hypothetical protein